MKLKIGKLGEVLGEEIELNWFSWKNLARFFVCWAAVCDSVIR